jgi:protein arginine kinase activator
MYCERCKRNDATVHLTEIIKNVKSEIHLCESCAREVGLNSKLSNFTLAMPDMLSFLELDDQPGVMSTERCGTCGMTVAEYRKTGKLGCPDCYHYMQSSLEPLIISYHGSNKHVGKVPSDYIDVKSSGKIYIDSSVKVADRRETAIELRMRLERAVQEERYEDAAVLRDMIRRAESGD